MSWRAWAAEKMTSIGAAGRRRQVRDFDGRAVSGTVGGAPVVSFASNDYLGLSAHPDVVAAAHDALDRWGAGTGAARLIVGSRPVHSALENEIATWKQTDRALLFSTGFAANLGVIGTLCGPDVLICSDELNHASIVDGCRLAKARVAIYPHGDVGAVERILSAAPARAMVVSDTVFSMDGDIAPVDALADVCRRHGALLVVDEAHAVLGPEPDFDGAEVLRVGTLSKFVGAIGGFVAGPEPLIDVLVNCARPFIFTTAPAPADAAAALASVRIIRSPEGDELKKRLRARIDRVAPDHPSPIIPFVLGDERAAVAAASALLERGLLVPAIRPPSVPAGSSRLRVTLSAAHSDDQVEALAGALDETLRVTAGV